MDGSSQTSQTLYPSTSLAYLPQKDANEVMVLIYLCAFSLGILVCDIASHDLRVIREFRLSLPYVVYFMSRVVTFVFALFQSILITYPFPDCEQAGHTAHVTYALSVSLTSLLFLFRVHAVFLGNRRVVVIFSILWLSVPASSLASIFGMGVSNLGSSRFCTVDRMEPYIAAGMACLAIYDTLVFIAITIRLFRVSSVPLEKAQEPRSWRSILRGNFLPAFSQALFRDGQSYYCVAMICTILEFCMMLAPVPIPYHDMFASFSFCFTNIMACRVFRKTKQAMLSEDAMLQTASLHFVDQPAPSTPTIQSYRRPTLARN